MKTKIKFIVSSLLFTLFLYSCMDTINNQAKEEMQKIENQVAQDAVTQYEISKKHGDKMDAYVQASMVCAAYLQANDSTNYKKWKEIEREEAKIAGMPVQ